MSIKRFSDDLIDPLVLVPDHCMIGVSGGVDSITLLHALIAAGKSPIVLHFNHGWRKEAVLDVALVKKTAKSLDLDFHLGAADKKTSQTESSAREARYAFFKFSSKKFKCKHLVLAHHAEDQIETFLHQILRGGASRAAGMKATHEVESLILHRPWLGVHKKSILQNATRNHLQWNDDNTNKALKHRRNWIRHRLLPYLVRHTDKALPVRLLRTIEVLRDESDWMEKIVDQSKAPSSQTLSVKEMRLMPVAQARLTIRDWLKHNKISDVDYNLIDSVMRLATTVSPAKINLPGSRYARRTKGSIWIE